MKDHFNDAIEKLSADPEMEDFRFGFYFLPQDNYVVMTVETPLVRGVKRKFKYSMKRLHQGVHSPEVRIYDRYLKMVAQFKQRYPLKFSTVPEHLEAVVARAKDLVDSKMLLSYRYFPGGEGTMSGVEVQTLDGSMHFVTTKDELKSLLYKEMYSGKPEYIGIAGAKKTVEKKYSLEPRAIPQELTKYIDTHFQRGSGSLMYAKGWYWKLRDQGASLETALRITKQKMGNRLLEGKHDIKSEDLEKLNAPWEKPVKNDLVYSGVDFADTEKRVAAEDYHARIQARGRMKRKGQMITPKDFIISDAMLEESLQKKRDALHDWQKKIVDSITEQMRVNSNIIVQGSKAGRVFIDDKEIHGLSPDMIVLDEAPRSKKPLTDREQALVNSLKITENQNVHSHRLGYMNTGLYDKDYKDE